MIVRDEYTYVGYAMVRSCDIDWNINKSDYRLLLRGNPGDTA